LLQTIKGSSESFVGGLVAARCLRFKPSKVHLNLGLQRGAGRGGQVASNHQRFI
jgi:hypothetical protein